MLVRTDTLLAGLVMAASLGMDFRLINKGVTTPGTIRMQGVTCCVSLDAALSQAGKQTSRTASARQTQSRSAVERTNLCPNVRIARSISGNVKEILWPFVNNGEERL